MAKPRRHFQYRVTEVWGSMEGRIEVKSEGEATPEQYVNSKERPGGATNTPGPGPRSSTP